jgi:DNA-binding transcriptional LysR family regulator
MRGLDLDHLAAFAAVAELGSFRAAAERLHLTQPAVSIRVRRLEERLGLPLFERVGRRVMPTSAGRRLLSHVPQIDAAVTAALEAVADYAHYVAGRVRIGTGATACIHLLPPVLRELRRRFPAVEILVRTGNTPDILKSLEENALDVALVTLPAPGRMFAAEALVADEIVAVFPRERAAPRPATPAALAVLPVLLYEPGGSTRRLIDDWFRTAGISLDPVMELGSVEAIKQLIAAGLGCGLLPLLAVAGEAELVVRSLTPALHRRIGLVMRRDKIPDRALKEVVAALRRLGGG